MLATCKDCGRVRDWKASRGTSLGDIRCRHCGGQLARPREDYYYLLGQKIHIPQPWRQYSNFAFRSGVRAGLTDQEFCWTYDFDVEDYIQGYQRGRDERARVLAAADVG
jgi:hypothetical protein